MLTKEFWNQTLSGVAVLAVGAMFFTQSITPRVELTAQKNVTAMPSLLVSDIACKNSKKACGTKSKSMPSKNDQSEKSLLLYEIKLRNEGDRVASNINIRLEDTDIAYIKHKGVVEKAVPVDGNAVLSLLPGEESSVFVTDQSTKNTFRDFPIIVGDKKYQYDDTSVAGLNLFQRFTINYSPVTYFVFAAFAFFAFAMAWAAAQGIYVRNNIVRAAASAADGDIAEKTAFLRVLYVNDRKRYDQIARTATYLLERKGFSEADEQI